MGLGQGVRSRDNHFHPQGENIRRVELRFWSPRAMEPNRAMLIRIIMDGIQPFTVLAVLVEVASPQTNLNLKASLLFSEGSIALALKKVQHGLNQPLDQS